MIGEGRDHTPVAIITGASQGIGAGLVAGYRRARYAVVGVARSLSASDDESEYAAVGGDIAEAETARRAVDQALDRFGRIDTLINNAGVYVGKPFIQYTVEDYAAIVAVNLTGFFHITQLAIEQMVEQRSGHVVNISTSLVDRADSKRPSALPALTKGGLVAASRSLAIEYASHGVRVNAVSPGAVVSEAEARVFADRLQQYNDWIIENQCLKQRIQPEDVAELVLFLASDRSRMITGQNYAIDGGW